METSILNTVKESLGIPADYTHFDGQIISDINGVFTILHQLGVGPDEEFSISDASSVWSDFISEGNLHLIQQYVNKRVRLMFDTSTISSYALDALQKEIAEYEWRLNVMADNT